MWRCIGSSMWCVWVACCCVGKGFDLDLWISHIHICRASIQGGRSPHSWAISPQVRLVCHQVSLQHTAVFLHFPPPSQLRPLRGSIKQVRRVGVGSCVLPQRCWIDGVSTVTGRLEPKIYSIQHLKYRPLESVCQPVHLLRYTDLKALARAGWVLLLSVRGIVTTKGKEKKYELQNGVGVLSCMD